MSMFFSAERAHLQFRRLLEQGRRDVREFVAVRGEQIGKPAAQDRAGGADQDAARLAVADRNGLARRRIHLLEDRFRARMQSFTRGGQLDPAAGAQQQLRLQERLEILNLLAQRRLRDAKPERGTRETEFLRDGHEIPQVTELDAHSYLVSIDQYEQYIGRMNAPLQGLPRREWPETCSARGRRDRRPGCRASKQGYAPCLHGAGFHLRGRDFWSQRSQRLRRTRRTRTRSPTS